MTDHPVRNNPPTPTQRRKSGIGCWLTGMLTLCMVTAMVAVGLFLPPVNLYDRIFGEQYASLRSAGDSIATDDGTLRLVTATDVDGTFDARLEQISLTQFESGSAEVAGWVPDARGALPPYLALQSPVYDIETRGEAPDVITLSMDIPGGAAREELLDLYAYEEASGEWSFLPSQASSGRLEATIGTVPDKVAIVQAAPRDPVVLVTYDVQQVLTEEIARLATIVSPAGLQPTLEGKITGSLAPGFNMNAGYMVMPVLRNYADPRVLDTETINTILSNPTLRRQHAREITLLTSGGGFDGVFIDYRGVDPELRDEFSRFTAELRSNFDQLGLLLGVTVPEARNEQGVWETGAYDWRAIGASADYLQIEMGINPRAYIAEANEPVHALLRWATGEVSRYRLLLGLTAQSVREISGTYTPIGYDAGLAGLGDVQVEAAERSETGAVRPGTEIRARLDGMQATAGVDTRINTPYINYIDDSGAEVARIWLTTGDALRYRMDRTIPYALAGVAFSDLLSGDLADGVLEAIVDYKAQIPSAPAPTDLALRWRIEGSEGLIDEVTTDISEELVVTLTAPDGNYAINVAVIGTGQQEESARSGAAVALFRPTPTPTPLPTATPTPPPTVTPTPAPVIPTAAPANSGGGSGEPSGSGFSAAAPGPGSIQVSGFEYGGHVTNTSSERAINAMRSAGMTWMKVQIRYTPGASPEIAAGAINGAKSNGFKILIGTVGNPFDLASGGDAYVQGYAAWLGGIAALGADAIEVWNEPNIDREWPRGQISGAAYTNMLRLGYQAIKSANSSTMVISGAPAPTGAAAAFPDQIVNDNDFLRDMVNSGALQYMDCVGVHYNEGIVPPTQNANDPRGDSYYTRFFPGMLNTYWNIVGGQKPLCFTELGYLSAEGYPPLPAAFSWASNVTVAQQAAWLAQATALASQSGRVRLLIVWNIDFTQYGGDPQGGYAIIRPDGSCPACSALAAAR